ncbi:MAG: [Christensenellaceae bacterium]|nr:[FeFe] hydrogenase H-cluster maturation GTPase HydF [Christensenellaceae bacterium]
MGLNAAPSANRLHIGFFGRMNAGKSSVVNAVTGQENSIVSDTKGTTTDPVMKTMELLPLGPVVIIDTPGFDDVGSLGSLRVEKAKRILNRTDIAVLVVDGQIGISKEDEELTELFKKKNIPYIIAHNKADLAGFSGKNEGNEVIVSAADGKGIFELKELLGKLAPKDSEKRLLGDLIEKGDVVVLVTPIDESAPKGRLILPQQLAIRDILDADATVVVTKETGLEKTLKDLAKPPKMVITDSQVFGYVQKIVPEDVPLTSFSILMARYKGYLETAVRGVRAIADLKDGDTVLMAEGCTHHRQCNDIGTVKIPNWLRKFTGKDIKIETSSGFGFPEDLSKYAVVIHCGGCMLNEREVLYRMKCAEDQGTAFTNYGVTIAYINGILKRSTSVLPGIAELLK